MTIQIEQLRTAYNRIETIDPDSPTYKVMCDWLDMQSTATLQTLVDAKVKFVSGLARNRIMRRRVS